MAKNLKKTVQTKSHEDPKTKSFFEKLFGVPAPAVNWTKEIMAGLTGLLGTVFVLFAFQRVLGLHYQGAENLIIVGTLVAMILTNIAQSIWARVPYIVTPSIGLLVVLLPLLNVAKDLNTLMMIILVEGILFTTISFLPFAKKVVSSIPASVKHAIVLSMGLMLVFLGIYMSGIFGDHIVPAGNLTLDKLRMMNFTNGIPSLSIRWLLDARTIVMAFGLVTVAYFSFTKNRMTLAWTIILTAAFGMLFVSGQQGAMGLTRVTPITFVDIAKDTPFMLPFGNWASGLLFKPDLSFFYNSSAGLLAIVATFIIFLARDTIGTSIHLVALGRQSGDMGENDENHHNAQKAMQVIGFNRIISGLVGGIPADISHESAVAVEADGRTSITPLVFASGCVLLLVGFNLFAMIPAIAVAPVFVMIGAGMLRNIGKIHWKDALEAIPAATMMILAALTLNLFIAVTIGVSMYLILRVAVWKFDDAPGGFWIFGLASLASVILYFVSYMR